MKKLLFSLSFVLFLTACQSNSGQQGENTEEPQVACTQDAKLCPDGSYVGRTGPNCEFAECPTPETPDEQNLDLNQEEWKTFTDETNGFSFKYPDPLENNYITLLANDEFFPRVEVSKGAFSCQNKPVSQTDTFDGPRDFQESKTINGETYCIKKEGDAAAGSNYITYYYTKNRKQDKNNLISLVFTLREVNCGNYDDPQKSKCEKEQEAFNPDDLAVKILDTVTF